MFFCIPRKSTFFSTPNINANCFHLFSLPFPTTSNLTGSRTLASREASASKRVLRPLSLKLFATKSIIISSKRCSSLRTTAPVFSFLFGENLSISTPLWITSIFLPSILYHFLICLFTMLETAITIFNLRELYCLFSSQERNHCSGEIMSRNAWHIL